MYLTTENLRKTMLYVLPTQAETDAQGLTPESKAEDFPETMVISQGLVRAFVFNAKRLHESEATVRQMLADLPDSFMADKGGGMSFLSMPFDKENHQWGEQPDAEELFALGQALHLCTLPLSRDLWSSLPGGVPYVTVTL